MKTRTILPALALGLSLLGGCAVTHEQAREQLAAVGSCCAGYADFPYRPLAAGETAILEIGSKSPAFAFPAGKSFFEAFRLPDRRGAAWVRVRSYAQGDRIDRAHVFFPNVLMLDDRHRVVAEIVPRMAAIKGSRADAVKENDWGMPARLQGEVALAPNYRYMVLRTTDALLAGQSPYVERIGGLGALGAAAGMVPQGAFAMKHSPVGRVALELVAE